MDESKNYRVVLRREHLTQKFSEAGSSYLQGHYIESTEVRTISVQFDALDPANVEKTLAAVAQQIPQEPEWGPWKLDMVSDTYEYLPAPPVAFAPESPAGCLLAYHLAMYPSLFGVDDYAPYRAMEHWFCTIGNGLEWSADGMLVYRDAPAITPAQVSEAQQKMLSAQSQAEIEEMKHRIWMFGSDPIPRPAVWVYPLSSPYSKLCIVPENVEDSFLVAFYQLTQFLLTRPAWENYSYEPDTLVSADVDVYATDDWRHIMFAEGMRVRALIQAAVHNVLGNEKLAARLALLTGKVVQALPALDYRLPPRVTEIYRQVNGVALSDKTEDAKQGTQEKKLTTVEKVIAGLEILKQYDDAVYCEHDRIYAGGETPEMPDLDAQRLTALGWHQGDHGWERSV